MAYNNNNRGNYNSNNRNYNNANNSGGDNEVKKRSGCKTGTSKTGKAYVRGWKYDKTHGMRSFIFSKAKNSKQVISKNGISWMTGTVKVSHPMGVTLYNALLQVDTDKVFISDLGLMMNPKARNGGYVGPYFRRKNK